MAEHPDIHSGIQTGYLRRKSATVTVASTAGNETVSATGTGVVAGALECVTGSTDVCQSDSWYNVCYPDSDDVQYRRHCIDCQQHH